MVSNFMPDIQGFCPEHTIFGQVGADLSGPDDEARRTQDLPSAHTKEGGGVQTPEGRRAGACPPIARTHGEGCGGRRAQLDGMSPPKRRLRRSLSTGHAMGVGQSPIPGEPAPQRGCQAHHQRRPLSLPRAKPSGPAREPFDGSKTTHTLFTEGVLRRSAQPSLLAHAKSLKGYPCHIPHVSHVCSPLLLACMRPL